VPAPADPLLHALAGLRAGPGLTSASRGRLAGGVLAAVTTVTVASCATVTVPAHTVGTTWWQGSGGVSACGPPAVYRVNGGPLQSVGDCAGHLLTPPTHVIVAVGGEVDVHIAEEGSGPSGDQLAPIFPTPSSDDTSVLKPTSIDDGGATESFVAVGPGTANVVTDSQSVLEVGVS
jgi:hypothetical protein